jgi:hypothetical protein
MSEEEDDKELEDIDEETFRKLFQGNEYKRKAPVPNTTTSSSQPISRVQVHKKVKKTY